IRKQQDMPMSIMMNRCESTKEGRQILSRFSKVIHRFLEKEVHLLGMLPDDKTVSTAVMRQTPYVLLDERAPVSKAMIQIVSNYVAQTKKLNTITSGSFVQKLKRLLSVR